MGGIWVEIGGDRYGGRERCRWVQMGAGKEWGECMLAWVLGLGMCCSVPVYLYRGTAAISVVTAQEM